MAISAAQKELERLSSLPVDAPFSHAGELGVMTATIAAFTAWRSEDPRQEVAVANAAHVGRVEIRQTSTEGHGVFALKRFEEGELLFKAAVLETGKVARAKNMTMMHRDKWIVKDLPARCIDHCSVPNTRIQENGLGAYDYFALRSIEVEEELTLDYVGTETEEVWTQRQAGRNLAVGKGKGMGDKRRSTRVRSLRPGG